MNFNEIKELIQIINDSQLRSFQLNTDGTSLSMSKNDNDSSSEKIVNNITPVQQSGAAPVASPVVTSISQAEAEVKPTIDVTSGNIIKSPIVGTFYVSSKPGSPAIKSKGDKVKKGEVVCIGEAMKIMNEITSEFDGVVEEIFPQNEQLVEFGQPLFKIV